MKIIIAGAGSSGLILARELAKLGIGVHILERKKKILPIYGSSGILSVKGLDSLKINYKDCVLNKLYGANIHFCKTSLHIHSKKPQAYVVDRTLLAEELYGEAVGNGANIEFAHALEKSEISRLKGIVVGAEGVASQVARYYKFPPIRRYVLTFRAEYTAREDMDNVEIFFDNSIMKGFFGWIAPHGDKVEVGAGIEERYGKGIEAYKNFLAKKEVKNFIKGKPLVEGGGIIPISLRKRFVYGDKKSLLVGDAAGQVKSSTGGGIIFGGNAAIIASDAISKYLEYGSPLENYEKQWRKKFGKDMKLHRIIHYLYSSPNDNILDFLATATKTLGIENFLSKYGDMDSPSLIIKRFFLRKN
ncbi:MAG: FAD-dependent monooxygenase [Candidatus Micrarchaeia archaeon]